MWGGRGDLESLNSDYRYAQGRLLHGVIYLHRISDNRISGTSKRNFQTYQELCGPEALSRSVIVTTMWSRIDNTIAVAYEEELRSNVQFFEPALSRGAELLRYEDTKASAHAIIHRLVAKSSPLLPLHIQRELVDEKKKPSQTVAGETLLRELAKLEQNHLNDLQELEREMAEARSAQDEIAVAELQEEKEKLEAEQKRYEEEKAKLLQLQLSFVELRAMMHTASQPAPSSQMTITPSLAAPNLNSEGAKDGGKASLERENGTPTVNGDGSHTSVPLEQNEDGQGAADTAKKAVTQGWFSNYRFWGIAGCFLTYVVVVGTKGNIFKRIGAVLCGSCMGSRVADVVD